MKYLEFKTLKDIDGIETTFASEEVLKKDWDRPEEIGTDRKKMKHGKICKR